MYTYNANIKQVNQKAIIQYFVIRQSSSKRPDEKIN